MICASSVLDYTDNYTYDLNSNRIGETEDQGNTGSTTDTVTSTYNGNDELTQSVDANTGTTVYGYDANGSQTSVTHTPNGTTTPDTTTTNEYDLQGQLAGSQVTTSAGTAKTTYYYDDSGNRIEETTTAAGSTTPVVTYYLVDTNNPTGYSQPIEQAATPGSPQITYIWGAQLISETYATGATIPGVGTATSPTTYYILTDAHGNTRLITDATGKVVEDMNYDAFGNALGFNAATALTTYLYSSMPIDAASGNYYDHARYFDTGTGSFTQSDYGYSGSLADPMSGVPYMFAGGDPINMLDLSGHDFSLSDTIASIAINTVLSSAISEAATPFVGYVAAALIPPGVLAALETAGSPDAIEFGVAGSASARLGASPFSLGGTAGLELLVSPHNGNAALYGYAGGVFGAGGSTGKGSAGAAVSAGVVWNSPSSKDYQKWFGSLTLPFIDLPATVRSKLAKQLAVAFASSELLAMPSVDSGYFIRYGLYNANYAREAAQEAARLVNGLSTSVNIFVSPSAPYAFGVSIGLGLQFSGSWNSPVSTSGTYYFQLFPSSGYAAFE